MRAHLGFLVLSFILVFLPTLNAKAQTGLEFDGSNDYVTFGSSADLGVTTFTIEAWVRRDGPGVAASTGTGGVVAIPLVTKGRGEADGNNRDMNWFLGIRESDGVLTADFEEGAAGASPGLNHPVVGVTPLHTGLWYHVAVTYDGTSWRLYVNGLLETELAVGQPPRSDSIQHAALATALTSTGSPSGYFDGAMDEARVWDYALSQPEIQNGLPIEITSATGLVGRWGLNDGSGTTAANSVAGGSDGTLVNGPLWQPGAPFELSGSLGFGGTNGYVTFGDAPALDLATFTVEAWVRRDGAGISTTTGSGGVSAIPLVTKGRGEADGDNRDMNWFFGIRDSDGVLTADFEEGAGGTSPGLNHPVAGTTPLDTGVWYHAAVTYDGTTWRLYLNGTLDGELLVGEPPRSDSIQHAALASALTSTGSPAGYFDGALDEVRVWDYARSETDIQGDINERIEIAQAGLVARWGLDEGAGTTVYATAGTTADGSLQGTDWTWAGPAPFDIVVDPQDPPAAPTNLTATASSAYSIDLDWSDNADNEQSYEVERSESGAGGPFAPLAVLAQNTTSYEDTSLNPETEYCYRVRATNSIGESAWTTPQCETTPAEGDFSLDLGGSDAYVSFGPAPELGQSQFTIETWVRRDGPGIAGNTGNGGIIAIPLVTKGRGEADGNNQDMNWFVGIRQSDGVLAADFEEGAAGGTPGLNHPVIGNTPLTTGLWYHVAATYDGTTWRLYLNGQLDAELTVGEPPRFDSIQHAALGTALNSSGSPEGYLDGVLDEVRVWNYARSLMEIQTTINDQISTAQTGLVGRWGLNEGTGTTVFGTAETTVDGTIVGLNWSWIAGAPFDIVINPPDPPAAPTDLAATAISPIQIDLSWTDNASNEQTFQIERSTTGPGGLFAPLDSTFANVTNYSDTGLDPSTEYCYRVYAKNSAGSSDTSNVDCATTLAVGDFALDFGGTDAYVSFGEAPTLGLTQFTIETWVRRDGPGVASNTGAGGVMAIPLVTKGRGEVDGSNLDMNWFLGIRESDGVLAADFEEGDGGTSPGLNHPVAGSTPLQTGVWHHAAATYDGTTWRLYLDGVLDGEVTIGQPPQSGSLQHAALGSALTSTGTPEGYLDGVLDEVRVWDYARNAAEIQGAINLEITGAQAGLVARWGLNEGAGTTVSSSAGTALDGTITGANWFWTGGAPFDIVINLPPLAPLLNSPADGSIDVALSPTLDVTVEDPEGQPLTATFYGRPVGDVATSPFTIIHLPDTQFYSESFPAVFQAQTQWIVDQIDSLNIAYVDHVGDIVENGDANPSEWSNAWSALSLLEDPLTTGLPEGTPYSASVGNHDQSPIGDPNGTTDGYNQYFGVDHFAGRSYYGGNYGSNNDNHFSFFSAGGLDFITVSIEYDTSPDADVLAWADSLLAAHADRWAMVSYHNLIGTGNPASFTGAGLAIYDALKDQPNLFLMICGHVVGEGQRSDVFDGRTVHTIMADYQNRPNGGDGWLRIMRFVPELGELQVQTYSPTLDQYETDANSEFTLPVDLVGLGGWQLIGTASGVPSGGAATVPWAGLLPETEYEWYVVVSDGTHEVTGPIWSFTTGTGLPFVQVISPNGGETLPTGGNYEFLWTATDDGAITGVDLLLSRDGLMGTYETIIAGAPNTGAFTWTVTGPETADAWFRVVAYDDTGNTAGDTSDGAFAISGVSGVDDGGLPRVTALHRATPNPFQAQAVIRFDLAIASPVRLAIFDVNGRLVRELVRERQQPAGRYQAAWNGKDSNGRDLAGGIYFARIEVGDYRASTRLTLIR